MLTRIVGRTTRHATRMGLHAARIHPRSTAIVAVFALVLVLGGARRSALPNSPPNVLALTPPMGWNSWNHFGCNVSESLIKETADSIAANGMRDAGYRYVVIDDCWQVSRADDGTIVADAARFPHGAHFSTWAVMAAPLMAGNDARTMSEATKTILLNPEVIAVDQDSLGAQGVIAWEPTPDLQVWSKKLHDGAIAVALLNRSTAAAKISANFWRAGLHVDSAKVRDLWKHADLGMFKSEFGTTVPAHGVVMVRVTPVT